MIDNSQKIGGAKNITLVIPTRGRPKNINRLVESINHTTKTLSKLEVVFRVDDDDDEGLKTVVGVRKGFSCIIIVAKRDKMLSNLWDDSFPYTTAARTMMCADDVIFRTQGWDQAVQDAMPDPMRQLHFCYGNDLNQRRNLATLPIMSRAWIRQVGYFVPRGYSRDWCDTHLHDIAKKLLDFDINCIIYLENVIFEHMHHSIGKAQIDDTYSYRLSLECGEFGKRDEDRKNAAQRLRAYTIKSR